VVRKREQGERSSVVKDKLKVSIYEGINKRDKRWIHIIRNNIYIRYGRDWRGDRREVITFLRFRKH
jgi:hypothetical protein